MENYLTRFLEYGRDNLDYSIYTLKGYKSDIRAFWRWLVTQGVLEPSGITRQLIERYDVTHSNAGKKPETRRRKICAIRAFCAWLLEEEKAITSDPSRRLKLPIKGEPERTAPTAREKERLFEGACRLESDYECAMATVMLACMFYAGLRPMEAIALELADIDLEKRVLIVQKGKGRKRREVPINETLAAHIATWLPVRLTPRLGTPLIVSPQHRAMTYYLLRVTFLRVKIAGGLRSATGLTAHCLRHWFASTLYQNKVDLETIRKLLGHAALSSTQSYLHQMGNEMQDAVKGLDTSAPPLRLVEAPPAHPKPESRRRAVYRREA